MCKLFVMTALLLWATAGIAQPAFGPYASDGNTALLLHFDGDMSDASSTGATVTSVGTVSFSSDAPFGQSVYLDNSGTFPDYAALMTEFGNDAVKADSAYFTRATANDTSYLVVAPNGALDLDGDFTLELWVKYVDAQAWSSGGNLVSKSDADGNFNYRIQGNVDGRRASGAGLSPSSNFQAGYTEDNSMGMAWDGSTPGNQQQNRNSTNAAPVDSTTGPTQLNYGWLHVTYQQDATNGWYALAVHDASGNLVSYNGTKMRSNDHTKDRFYQKHPGNGAPVVSVGDEIWIGFDNNKSSHALIDELRISNSVRGITGVPPLISPDNLDHSEEREDVHAAIYNQDVSLASYEVAAYINVPGTGAVADAKVYYHTRMYPLTDRISIDATGWQSVDMAATGQRWVGNIPSQPFKTVVEYYIVANTSDGQSDTVGTNNARYNANSPIGGYGMPDTYYRFIVWKENSLIAHFDFENLNPNNSPVDNSEWDMQGEVIGAATYPADVPDGFGAPDVNDNFFSLHLDGVDAPGFIEFRDSDHINATSWTTEVWFKADALAEQINREAAIHVKHHGSRWSEQQEGWDENNAHGIWWENNPSILITGPTEAPVIQSYTFLGGDIPHPFLTNDQNTVLADTTGTLLTNKWFRLTQASRYNGDPTLHDIPEEGTQFFRHVKQDGSPETSDLMYHQIVDEDGVMWGYREHDLRVPPTIQRGPYRIGHRGGNDHRFLKGNVDELRMWNYYRGPDEDPDIWAYLTTVGIATLEGDNLPTQFTLEQNYPNPFNPTTNIKFSVPVAQRIELVIYDLLGQQVKTLVSRQLPAGEYVADWDGTNLAGYKVASGMYLYRLSGKSNIITKKMILLK